MASIEWRTSFSEHGRGRAVVRLEYGKSVTEVATVMSASKSYISLLKGVVEDENGSRKVSDCRRGSNPLQESSSKMCEKAQSDESAFAPVNINKKFHSKESNDFLLEKIFKAPHE
ncbi:hypothetical protein NPIL_28371 [Nephila pilipes]|uniref:Uncharacterized protein n=1 Tax=Nephila pilipes TaxID=299642 RepID=A0A8X6N4X1_NEPPI|nr:hypothetical protein NPIL_28371 [Nephila pilipes]